MIMGSIRPGLKISHLRLLHLRDNTNYRKRGYMFSTSGMHERKVYSSVWGSAVLYLLYIQVYVHGLLI